MTPMHLSVQNKLSKKSKNTKNSHASLRNIKPPSKLNIHLNEEENLNFLIIV